MAEELERPVSILGVALSSEDWASLRRSPILGQAEIFDAADCREALARLVSLEPRIVISEPELPDGSWRDILAASQDLPVPPPVIVASRLADERLWAEVLNLGGYDLVAKPLDTREVTRIMMAALNSRPFSRGGAPARKPSERTGESMFNSLDEQMERDDATSSTSRERWISYGTIAIVSILVFGGLYASILLLA